MDFTRPVREKLLQLYPHLAHVPTGGMETPLPPPPPIIWDELGNLIPVYPSAENPPEGESAPDEKLEEQEAAVTTTWHDVALSIAGAMMKSARDEIRTKLGYSTSAVRCLREAVRKY
jgi:DNA polymerase eta